MKLNFGKRLLLFLHWLLSVLICVLFVLMVLVPDFLQNIAGFINAAVGSGLAEILSVVFLAVYALISVFSLATILAKDKKRSERGLITVDASENGRTRVSVAAVEQMIRQAVRGVDGIAEMKCAIANETDAISVNINVTLLTGAHVPTVTMNMQRAIRGYIELNCGVAVREICINVNSVENSAEGRRSSKKNLTASAPVVPVAEAPVEAVQSGEIPAELPVQEAAAAEEEEIQAEE